MKNSSQATAVKYKNDKDQAISSIIFSYGKLKNSISDILKPYKITMQQYNVLRILNEAAPDPLSTSAIRNRMLDKMSDASRIVERLSKKGLVKRKSSKADKRLVDVSISAKGRNLIEKLGKSSNDLEDALKSLSKKDCKQLNEILAKMH